MASGISKALVGIIKTTSGSRKLSDETTEALQNLVQRTRAKPSYLTSASPNQGIADTVDVKARFIIKKADDTVEEVVENKPLKTGEVADNSNSLNKAGGSLNGKPENVLDSAKVATVTNPAKFGTFAKSALIGAASYGVLSVAGGISSQKEGGGEQVIVPGEEGSPTTYNYYTDNEAVNESLNWLQLQIDELVAAFNALLDTLFGGSSEGSGTESTPWDFLTYDESGATGGLGSVIGRIISNPIVIIGALAVVALIIVLYRRNSGGKKKGGKKK